MDKIFADICLTSICLTSLLLGGCAAPTTYYKVTPIRNTKANSVAPTTPSSIRAGAQTNETKEFHEIEALYKQNLTADAQIKIVEFIKNFPHSTTLPAVENFFGLLLLKDKKPSEASLHFQKAIELNPNNKTFNQYIFFNLASAQFDSNEINLAQQTVSKIDTNLLDNDNRLKLSYLTARILEKTTPPVDSHAVGILLPMKGKFAKYGVKSLQGIQLAFGIFNSEDTDSNVKLIVEDSGEEPEQAIKALNRLAIKHHVVAVIGPMLAKGAAQISQRAQELGVPLISLSRRTGPVQDYVFQGGMTQQLQAFEIARYAIQNLKLNRFAMIYPNDKMSTEMSENFWDAVESLGGKIVGVESYNTGETDFRVLIDKLSGLYYTEARQQELDLLEKARMENHITKKTRKTEKYYNLKPIVDYDAVFIPDEPKIAGQILPTFAYRDVENIKFLGTSSWNSPDFLSRVQSYGEKAAFVDAFFPESDSTLVQNFSKKYKSTYSQDPDSLEALAYDVGSILNTILTSTSHNLSRADIRDRLKAVHDFHGVTGNITYKDGQFSRNLTVITVKNGHFTTDPL